MKNVYAVNERVNSIGSSEKYMEKFVVVFFASSEKTRNNKP